MSDISDVGNPIPDSNAKAALDFILSNAFRSGFGTLGKTELDLILFTALMKYAEKHELSDHALSKYLQITKRRIRNLKETASVKYLSITRDEALERFVEQARYARIEHDYVDIPIDDVAVRNELEALLDENNVLLHYQLNPKIFRIRIDDFIDLAVQIEASVEAAVSTGPRPHPDEIRERIVGNLRARAAADTELSRQLEAAGTEPKALSWDSLKKAIATGGVSFGISLLASLIPGGTFVADAAKGLIQAIAKKV
ncbi:MAG: hypothetical protein ACOCZB_03010 [Spirochaetota bacterium]